MTHLDADLNCITCGLNAGSCCCVAIDESEWNAAKSRVQARQRIDWRQVRVSALLWTLKVVGWGIAALTAEFLLVRFVMPWGTL